MYGAVYDALTDTSASRHDYLCTGSPFYPMGNSTLNSHWDYRDSVYQTQAAAYAVLRLKATTKLPIVGVS